ncbi:MAG: hypothetical protein AAGK21_02250 [Bacteroidota bacterium]
MSVLLPTGVAQEAIFEVVHTENWPSGASWEFTNGHASLPFTDVRAWSPDPTAQPPAHQAQTSRVAPSGGGTAQLGGAPAPAIVKETIEQIDLTATVLRMMPSNQYDWSPHPEIATLRTLSRRLVRIVARIGWILDLEAVELSFEPDLPDFDDADTAIMTYSANADMVRDLLPNITAETLRRPWRLERNGVVIETMPCGGALRRFGITPIVYHRGEAAVLLTALGQRAPHPYPLWAFQDESTAQWSGPDASTG